MDNDRRTNPDRWYIRPACSLLAVTAMSVEPPFDGVRNSHSVHRKILSNTVSIQKSYRIKNVLSIEWYINTNSSYPQRRFDPNLVSIEWYQYAEFAGNSRVFSRVIRGSFRGYFAVLLHNHGKLRLLALYDLF